MPEKTATPSTDLDTDEAIVLAVLDGERERFGELVTRHNQRLYRVGWAYLRQHAPVEDAMQNTYLKAFVSLGKFSRRSGFATWLTRIMINECLMILRQRRSRREDSTEPETLDRSAWTDTPVAATLNLDDMKAILEQAIGQLPAAYRAVFMLRDVQQLSTAETASCLGISTVAAKVKLHRARAMIKEALLRNSVTNELFAYNAPYCQALTLRVMKRIRELPIEN